MADTERPGESISWMCRAGSFCQGKQFCTCLVAPEFSLRVLEPLRYSRCTRRFNIEFRGVSTAVITYYRDDRIFINSCCAKPLEKRTFTDAPGSFAGSRIFTHSRPHKDVLSRRGVLVMRVISSENRARIASCEQSIQPFCFVRF